MKRGIIIGVVVLALLSLMIVKLKSNQKDVQAKIYIHDAKAAVSVEAINPNEHTFESSLTFLGVFDPNVQNTIGSDASGKIIRINVQEGDKVGKGTVLAKIDDELLQLQLQNAEVTIEGQQNDDNRYSTLVKENAVSGVQAEKTKLGLRQAQIQKKTIQKQLKNTTVVAPFSGTITKKSIDLGSVVGPGTQLFEITDIANLKLTVSVPERDIMKFKLNQSVSINADIYGDRQFSGKVTNISIVADKSHNFKVQVTVPNPKQELRAGMYGSVRLTNNSSKTALSIPRKAMVGSSKKPQVFVIRDGKAKLVSFTAGTSDGEYIEVVDGLQKGDQIVVKGQVNLQDGSNVKLLK